MSSTEPAESVCPSCGKPLDPSIMGGSCPACLFTGIINVEKKERSSQKEFPEIEGYEILEEIGHGGMGVVYRATQESPSREVALKIVAPYSLRASQARERFLVEVETMASVEHPGLLPLYDSGEDDYGRPWLTMQLAEGGSLAEKLDDYQGDWKASARLVQRLCEAIYFAHERGILHRDLKPANILFNQEGHPFVADFGLAKWADRDGGITHSSTMLGSPAYLAPEAAREGSEVTTTVSDVYGLGAILYELLVGAKPYEGDQPAQVITQILDGSPPAPRKRLKNIPRDLEVIVLKAMAREPEKRYFSAAAFAEDLGLWLDGRAIRARPVGTAERMVIWARRNPAVATLAFLFLASLVAGGILLWKSNQKLTASLDDAEARVDFMTRELPAKLRPLGRLDLLEDVFEDVAKHHEMSGDRGPESLARYADFLTEWSQIARSRGQFKLSKERAREALEKAEKASREPSPSLNIMKARCLACYRLTELLVDNEEFEEARTDLEETLDFALKHAEEETELQVLIAQLWVEKSALLLKREEADDALIAIEKASVIWKNLMPKFAEAEHQTTLARYFHNAIQVIHIRGEVKKALGDEDAGSESYREREALVLQARKLMPDDLSILHELVMTRRGLAWSLELSAEEKKEYLLATEAYAEFLFAHDDTNVFLQTNAVLTVSDLIRHSQSTGDQDEHMKWVNVMGKRMTALYLFAPTDVKFLAAHRSAAAYCGQYFSSTDWELGRFHLEAMLRIQGRLALISDDREEAARYHRMVGRVEKLMIENEGEEATQQWKENLVEIPNHE